MSFLQAHADAIAAQGQAIAYGALGRAAHAA